LGFFTSEDFETRIFNLRKHLTDEGLDVGIAFGTPHLPGDVQYLTGYDPHIESAIVIVTPTDVIPMGGAEGATMFADSGQYGEWRNLSQFEIPYQDYGRTKFWSISSVLNDLFGSRIPKSVGVLSDLNVFPTDIYLQISAITSSVKDVSWILRKLRYEKSPKELEAFAESSKIAERSIKEMLKNLEPGMTEMQVAAFGDYTIKSNGAYSLGYDTMVCSANRINTVIGRASSRVINDGDMVLIGSSPRFQGYASTVGRTVVAGNASNEQLDFLHHSCEALTESSKEFFEGNSANRVHLSGSEYLAKHDLAEFHMYGVGHGIGLSECLEEKTATAKSDYLLPRGLAMMLDIGLFGHPKFYGSRHEDPWIIDHGGKAVRLTDLPIRAFEMK
jgi:Xaa-Pro aminopeptidase